MSARKGCPVTAMVSDAAASMAWVRSLAGTARLSYAEATAPSKEVPACLVEPPSRPGGRLGREVVPLPELRAAGWRVLPVPTFCALSEGGRPSLHWFARDWCVVPPEGSPERARTFAGRGRAQRWASDRYRAERGGGAA